MPRTLWVAIGGVALGLVLALVVIKWLPGPRASLPAATAPPPAGTAIPTPGSTRNPVGLPDPALTPGSINPNVTLANLSTTICMAGWTATVRPPSAYTGALKIAQIVEYGYADHDPSHYQEDHLVPLELGGAPRDPRNLWPQPNDQRLPDGTAIPSAAKDGLEDYLNSAVCAGRMDLSDAQRMIAGDWIAAWQAAGQP